LDRLTKSKEAALLEAERTVQMALAKASLVDDLQNKNQELMKQIEICQARNNGIFIYTSNFNTSFCCRLS
jgi:lipid II:glycine glycyltransferase (peptidoglycan interpeptide bridge formation enzyme)